LTGQAFDHIGNKKEITELSAVFYADSFFCGFWDSKGHLLKSDLHPLSFFEPLLDELGSNYSIDQIKLVSTAIPYVHLPQDIYKESDYEHYFEGLYDLRKCFGRARELDSFNHIPVHTLHYLDRDILKTLVEKSIPFRMAHISTVMSNYAAAREADVLLYMHDKRFHVCCHKEGRFVFYNQFQCVDVNDYLYFILMVLQSVGIEQRGPRIYMGGEIDRSAKLYLKLRSYLPGLILVDDEIEFAGDDAPSGQLYFDLMLARTCV